MLFRSQLSKPTGSGECVCMSKTPEVSDLDSEFLFLFSVLCFWHYPSLLPVLFAIVCQALIVSAQACDKSNFT